MKNAPETGAAPGRSAAVLLCLATAAANILADRITKVAAAALLKGKGTFVFLKGLLVLRYTENRGAFLSLGQAWPEGIKTAVLLILPLLMCLALFLHSLLRERDRTRIVLFATIAAGGTGNLADRLFNDFYVIDFLNFGIGNLRTGILNVADLSITFGAVLLILLEFRHRKDPRGTSPQAEPPGTGE